MGWGIGAGMPGLNLCGCGAQAKSNRRADRAVGRWGLPRRSADTTVLLAIPARNCDLWHRPHAAPSGHGPAGLASARLTDERQAEGFALELVSIARAGEVD